MDESKVCRGNDVVEHRSEGLPRGHRRHVGRALNAPASQRRQVDPATFVWRLYQEATCRPFAVPTGIRTAASFMAAADQGELMVRIATHESQVHGERPHKWTVAEVHAIKRNIEPDEPDSYSDPPVEGRGRPPSAENAFRTRRICAGEVQEAPRRMSPMERSSTTAT